VELSSSRSVGFGEAEYAAKDGYRQAATNQTAGDLSKGEKTLAGFTFEDSKFGGKLHLPFYDGDGYDLGKLELVIK
jgi:hypothetical protein